MRALLLLLVVVSLVGCTVQTQRPMPLPDGGDPIQPQREKLTLVYIRSDGRIKCPHCDKMEQHTFEHPKVREHLAANHTVVKTSGRDADRRYNVTQYPTYILLDSRGREVRRGTGYREPEEFLLWLGVNGKSGDTGQSTLVK